MHREAQKYVGRVVEIIYQDKKGQWSQRKIEIRSVHGDYIVAFCLDRQASRVFHIDNVLAIQPVIRRAV